MDIVRGNKIEPYEIITKSKRRGIDKDFIKIIEEYRFGKEQAYKKPLLNLLPDAIFRKYTGDYDLEELPQECDILDSTIFSKGYITELGDSGLFDWDPKEIPSTSAGPTKREIMKHLLEKIKLQTIMTEPQAEKMFMECFTEERFKQEKSFDYVNNIPVSVFDLVEKRHDGFPKSFNVNRLETPLREIYQHQDGKGGYTSSWVYCNQLGSRCVIHTEDFDSMSVHYLFPNGQPQVWVAFDMEQGEIVNEIIQNIVKELNDPSLPTCSTPLLHKRFMLTLHYLNRYNITWYYTIQMPGSFIVVNPGIFHQVYKLGDSISEAANFYGTRMIQVARNRFVCQCEERIKFHKKDKNGKNNWDPVRDLMQKGEDDHKNLKFGPSVNVNIEFSAPEINFETVNVTTLNVCKTIVIPKTCYPSTSNSSTQSKLMFIITKTTK
uniref:JmjC domain-containing protein n=1 Tax=Panagrolaimus sp. ES5 TaxID=591445 RepID=A0AC34GTV4_9BILA